MGSGQAKTINNVFHTSDEAIAAPQPQTNALPYNVNSLIFMPAKYPVDRIQKKEGSTSAIVNRKIQTGSSQRSQSKPKTIPPMKDRIQTVLKDSKLQVTSSPGSPTPLTTTRTQRSAKIQLRDKPKEEPQSMLMLLKKKNKKQPQKDIPHGNWNEKTEEFVMSKRKDIQLEQKQTLQHVDTAIRKLMLLNLVPNPAANLLSSNRGIGVRKSIGPSQRANSSLLVQKQIEDEEVGVDSILSEFDLKSEIKYNQDEVLEKKDTVKKQNNNKGYHKQFMRKSLLDFHEKQMSDFLDDTQVGFTEEDKVSSVESTRPMKEEKRQSSINRNITPSNNSARNVVIERLPKIPEQTIIVEELEQDNQVGLSNNKPHIENITVVKMSQLRGRFLNSKNYQ